MKFFLYSGILNFLLIGQFFPVIQGTEKVFWEEKYEENSPSLYKKNEDGSYTFRRAGMGTIFSMTIYNSEKISEKQLLDISEKVWLKIPEWEKRASFFDAESELSKLNRTKENIPFQTSKELFYLIKQSLIIADNTNGAYDPTIGKLTRLWRKSRSKKTLPEKNNLQISLKESGYDKIILNETTLEITKTVSGLLIDLGGIAKGAVLDDMANELKKSGIKIYKISNTSDIIVGDPPHGLKYWKIKAGSCLTSVNLVNASISTSGTKNQFVEIKGEKYAHIIDPETGLGINTEQESTVIASTSMEADAYATALTVLNHRKTKGTVKEIQLPPTVKPLLKMSSHSPADL